MNISLVPLYPYSGYSLSFNKDSKLLFLDSGRSALLLAVNVLKIQHERLVFLLPAYTCYSVVDVMEQAGVEYNFVDLDDSLQFDSSDLIQMINYFSDRTVVLIPTALFGIHLKNYKKLYPHVKIIEDLSHSFIHYKYPESDFAFTSYGRGKMVSAWSGGVLNSLSNEADEYYFRLAKSHDVFRSFLLVSLQKIVSKYFWGLIENTRFNPEKNSLHSSEKIVMKRLGTIKSSWIRASLVSFNSIACQEVVKEYQSFIHKEYQYNLGELMPYIRFPIKKRIYMSGVSHINTYAQTYRLSIKKRNIILSGAKLLAEEVSFLPTHNLVTKEYAREIIQHVNKKHSL